MAERNRRTLLVGKKKNKKKEKTTPQQNGLPTFSADLNFSIYTGLLFAIYNIKRLSLTKFDKLIKE